jgi:DUF4097 and DUF4098 domain-containing protein YvlB
MKTKTTGLLMVALMALSVVACADSRMEKTLPLEPGGQFVLQSDGGSVTVTGSSDSGARIVITSNRTDLDSLYNFNFDSSPGVAQVTVRRKGFSWFSNVNLHFEVTVPTKTRVNVRTGGGSVRISLLDGEQNLGTSGGSIDASNVHGNVEARTSGGGISVSSLTGSLDARTSGGSIHIDGLTGRVDAHTSGGSIRATLSPGNGEGGDLSTSGGSIRVSLDPAVNLNLEASTSGGSVSTDLPVKVVGTISRSSLHGSIGSGGPTLRLHTSGGSIHISSH